MLACNCLNVVIESETNEFPHVRMEELNLSQDEMLEPFFRQAIQEVKNFKRLHKEYTGLVVSKVVGNWILHRCLNCDMHTHAIHIKKGSSFILVSSKLLTASTIKTLRDSGSYSQIFNVIVLSTNCSDETAKVPSSQNLTPEVELALTSLKQRANEAINKEMNSVEERVRNYTEKQYAALDKFKQTARSEHNSLVKTIVEKRQQSLNSTNFSSSPNNNRLGRQISETASANIVPLSERPKTNVRAAKTASSKRTEGDRRNMCIPFVTGQDTEDFFQFDDSDGGYPQSSASEREDSDREEITTETEGTRIVRSRSASTAMAKSLPVNIPNFMSQFRNRDTDDEHDDFVDEHPSDIAASIKALAKSVHGDAVFGDLPRPRFSTQI